MTNPETPDPDVVEARRIFDLSAQRPLTHREVEILAALVERVVGERNEALSLNNKSMCSYCGHVGPRDADYMIQHYESCETHPMKTLVEIERQRDDYRMRWESAEASAKRNGEERDAAEHKLAALAHGWSIAGSPADFTSDGIILIVKERNAALRAKERAEERLEQAHAQNCVCCSENPTHHSEMACVTDPRCAALRGSKS